MKPPVTVSPEEAVPSPTVPPDVQAALLRAASTGVTTKDAAAKVGLTVRQTWRYLELLRVAGVVNLRETEDGRSAEWYRTNGRKKA